MTLRSTKDIFTEHTLVSDSQDIVAILEYLGKEELLEDVGHMFVKVEEGDYSSVYFTRCSIPWNYLTEQDYVKLV